MTFSLPQPLESHLRKIAAIQHRDVDSLIREALQQFANAHPVTPNGAAGPATGRTEDRYPLRGTVLRYDDPCEPAIDPSEWDAMR